MTAQQHPHRLSSHPRYHSPLDRLARDQAYAPSCLPRRHRTAHHGYDLLPFPGLEQRLRSRSRFVVQRSRQTTLFIALAYLPHRVHYHPHTGRHFGESFFLLPIAAAPKHAAPFVPAVCRHSTTFPTAPGLLWKDASRDFVQRSPIPLLLSPSWPRQVPLKIPFSMRPQN
jgi:hypothetical protein